MSEQICHLYFQMVCQKLCQNSVPGVGITRRKQSALKPSVEPTFCLGAFPATFDYWRVTRHDHDSWLMTMVILKIHSLSIIKLPKEPLARKTAVAGVPWAPWAPYTAGRVAMWKRQVVRRDRTKNGSLLLGWINSMIMILYTICSFIALDYDRFL